MSQEPSENPVQVLVYVYVVYVYAFSRRFYPKRLTNEDITLQLM